MRIVILRRSPRLYVSKIPSVNIPLIARLLYPSGVYMISSGRKPNALTLDQFIDYGGVGGSHHRARLGESCYVERLSEAFPNRLPKLLLAGLLVK